MEAVLNPELRGVSEHMLKLGLGSLQHALRLAFYRSMENPSWPDLSVLHAAHAAEILLKARIAQEHPLLIFEKIPKTGSGTQLDFQDLFKRGQTLAYAELPSRLWAATGINLRDEPRYLEFGKIRNSIQHFAPPTSDPSLETLRFVFEVVDPFLGDQWGLFAIDFNEEYGDHYEHILEQLIKNDLRPRLSEDAARAWERESIPADAPTGYAKWFRAERARALGTKPSPRR